MNKELKLFLLITGIGLVVITIIVVVLLYLFQEKQRELTLEEKLKRFSKNYEDHCTSTTCSICKRDMECLSCLHNCYNRYGLPDKKKSAFHVKAKHCNRECYIEFEIPGAL